MTKLEMQGIVVKHLEEAIRDEPIQEQVGKAFAEWFQSNVQPPPMPQSEQTQQQSQPPNPVALPSDQMAQEQGEQGTEQ